MSGGTTERTAPAGPPRDAPPALTVRTSLHRGAQPPPGFLPEPFVWEDIFHTQPPPKLAPGERCLALPGREETDADIVVVEAVLVKVVCETDVPVVDVEHALYVDTRTLAGAIAVEERTVGVAVEKARVAGEEMFDSHERALGPSGRLVVKAERTVWNGLLRFLRSITTGIVTFPDRFRRKWNNAASFLGEKENRKQFWRGLVNPHALNREQKGITLFVAITSIFALMLLTHVVVTLVAPGVARSWRAGFLLYGFGLFSSVGIPIPIEPALLAASRVIGNVPTIATTVFAKVTAAWLVFFLGDEVNGAMERRAAKSPGFRRFLRGSEAFAQRFGVVAVALFLSIPGLPDAIALYVFGSLGMRLHWFLLGVAIGATALYTGVLYGLLHLLGLA